MIEQRQDVGALAKTGGEGAGANRLGEGADPGLGAERRRVALQASPLGAQLADNGPALRLPFRALGRDRIAHHAARYLDELAGEGDDLARARARLLGGLATWRISQRADRFPSASNFVIERANCHGITSRN
jgi:hypothetical protein